MCNSWEPAWYSVRLTSSRCGATRLEVFDTIIVLRDEELRVSSSSIRVQDAVVAGLGEIEHAG